jgi:hypothetical protein
MVGIVKLTLESFNLISWPLPACCCAPWCVTSLHDRTCVFVLQLGKGFVIHPHPVLCSIECVFQSCHKLGISLTPMHDFSNGTIVPGGLLTSLLDILLQSFDVA